MFSGRKKNGIGLVAASIVAAGVSVATGGLPASAAPPPGPAPVVPLTNDMLSADALPTVQVDGVVWSQAVVGNTVYAGGRFNNARPAGAAPGTNLTPRGNLLAYDIRTGNLVTSFAPSLNGQVLGVAASPDGSRIYVVGDFTTANGVARRRVAAYSTSNGQLITSFAPVGLSSQVRAVVATNDTVYVGGGFQGTGPVVRRNLAAFRASDGALLNWNPDADYTVWALAKSADGSSIFAGGSFQNVGGQPAYGLAKINATTGALVPEWDPIVNNAGVDAGISSLKVFGDFLYGTTWHFGPGGNLEGTFKAPVDSNAVDGDVEWVTDCHGDNYSSFLQNGVVYAASHAHYCGNMGGGHPQHSAWRFQNAQAWTDTVGGEIINEAHGYPNWHGVKPAPSMVNWLPVFTQGSFTGQGQAAWDVTGNNDYVVFGGEFPRINNTAQQGLVRFARRSISPKAQGPRFTNGQIVPTLVATSPNTVRVSWEAGFDYDDASLTYQVFRNNQLRYETTAKSNWWTLPSLGFVDTGLTPGTSYSYRIGVRDSDNHVVNGGSVSVTVPANTPAAVPNNSYANQVRADGARLYWPLNEAGPAGQIPVRDRAASGASAAGIGVSDGRADNGVEWNREGAVPGDTAARLTTENEWSRIFQNGTETAPDTFTAQVWIKTDTPSGHGGRILGFGDLQTGGSGHRDRHIYMNDAGQITFGVKAQDGSLRTVSSGRSYDNNDWHQVTATMSSDGMKLYVDGIRVGQRSDTTAGEAYLGYWRVGGDSMGWPNSPSNDNFIGDVDEVAIYPTALTQDQIVAQYVASGRISQIPAAPADAYGAAVYADEPDLYWRFGDTGGNTAVDSGKSLNDGTYRSNGGGIGGPTLGRPGALGANTAAGFDGIDDFVSSNATFSGPTVYTEEAWFKTTTTQGGKIIGFGCSQDSSSGCYDRHIYMEGNGKLVFGVWTGFTNTITTANPYNDDVWHHVVGTQAGDGMKLYVDGELVGTNPQNQAQDYAGWWKVGGDNTWSSGPYFNGLIDEAAVYSTALSLDRVRTHFVAGGGTLNVAPTAVFEFDVDQRSVSFDGTDSSDDGSITAYAWDFGDGHTDTGANPKHVFAPGTYSVKLTVTDNRGGTGTITHPVTVAAIALGDTYGNAVVADSPEFFWRFGESSGNTADDAGGGLNSGTYFNGYTLGQQGAVPGTSTAVSFDGSNGFASSNAQYNNPTVYSEEAWFKTTTTQGGKIIGFGRDRAGSSSSYDRHVYMEDDGQLVFGTYTGQLNTITSPASYNNGGWHHVVATQSGNGMKLYVDGVLVGTHTQTQAENYPGYWKVGGDRTWGSSSDYLAGTIDEVAVYLSELSADRVAAHFAAAQPANQAPTAAFTSTTNFLAATFNPGGSVDPDGTIAGYSWDYGDGTTGTDASHTYATAGTYTVTLTVTDDDGAIGTFSDAVSVVAPNQAPTAAFTMEDAFLAVEFDGSGSADPEEGDITYSWDFGDGTQAGSGETPTHTYAAGGTYTVKLTVTDDDGATGTISHDISVAPEPPNEVPTAAFTSTLNGLAASFTSASTDDGTITHAWEFGDGGTSTLVNPTHAYAAAGTYIVKLTVTDDDGATSTATDEVTVSPANQAPTAAFTSSSAFLVASFDSDDSVDPDGTIAEYAWNFGDGTTGTGPNPLHTYAGTGTYTVALTVTDDDLATTTISHTISVEAANQSPTAAFTPSNTFLVASFNSAGSLDPDGTITGYAWNFGDGSTGTGATASHTYATAGTYPVTLTVTDNKGATGTISHDITVAEPANQAPTAAFSSSNTFLVASFNSAGSVDPDGTIAGYAWNFGDGTSGTGATASHTYGTAGTYPVTLTVTDNKGATGTISHDITVAAQTELASDTFGRNGTGGWGAAFAGGTWGPNSSRLAVNGNAGTMSVTAGSGPGAYLSGVSARDVDATVEVAFDKPGTGGGVYSSLVVRRIGTSDYRLKVRLMGNTITAYLVRTVNGTETTLATQTIAGLNYQPGTVLHLRMRAVGSGTTTLQGRLWVDGANEPTTWNMTATDSTAALQAPGTAGIYTFLSSSATNGPVVVSYDDFRVIPGL